MAGAPLQPVELLGEGATSRALLAQRGRERLVIKLGRDAGQRLRFADEAERLSLVDSPWVSELRDLGVLTSEISIGGERVEKGAPYLAFTHVEGNALSRVVPEGARERERLALLVARQIGAALSELHELDAAHGDVKPDNILLSRAVDRAWLIDFGLAGPASAPAPVGGTRRYLAPEVFQSDRASDARRRDLYALGFVLAEILHPGLRDADAARAALDPKRAADEIALALLGSAASRPSAAWVSRRAASDSADDSLERTSESSERAVRRAYLVARRRDLAEAARAAEVAIEVGGACRAWLEGAVTMLGKVRALRGLSRAGTVRFGDLDAPGRARFAVALAGTAAAAWPPLPQTTDAALVERALAATRERAPRSLAYLDFQERAPAHDPHPLETDPLALVLRLRDPACGEEVLERLEQLTREPSGPTSLRVELGRTLRLRGETWRALRVLASDASPAARAELADVVRRSGDVPGAVAIARELSAAADAPADVKGRAAALLARVELDAGDAQRALELLRGAAETYPVAECATLAELQLGHFAEARSSAARARLLCGSDEQRARAESLFGMIAHAAGDAEAALAAFQRSSEFAARAGAVLEEATYATGVAAAAANVGDLGVGLAAARRALLLFEHLGRGSEAARAVLSIAAAYAAAGDALEGRDAAHEAIARARASGDTKCRAYAHLVLCDVAERTDEALEHVTRAQSLLGDHADDRIRCMARRLLRGGAVSIPELDASARRREAPVDARLEWWGARAERLLATDGPERGDAVLSELKALSRVTSPVSLRGPALLAGARLAARLGDNDGARHLSEAVAEAARELLRRAPDELRPAIASLPWMRRPDTMAEAGFSPQQIADVEALVRALGHRERLRPLLTQVLDALVLWTGVERGLLLLRAPNGKLKARAARNIARSDLQGAQLDLSMSLAARALEQGQPVVAVDAAGDLPEVHVSVHALKLRSVLAVPLVARGEPLGVVYLDDRVRRGAFGARELGWVKLVSTLAALAIADARDQLLLRRAARRAERAKARLDRELSRREAELDVAERELSRVRDARATRYSYERIVGQSEAVQGMLHVVDRVTNADVPVLLIGESGSGKELVARAIHDNGRRSRAPFVSENCAAIPETLLESTLFGHVKGAFTGAQRSRAGLFEVAHRGTLFLDEIGEMSLGMQTKLLRALQSGEVRPVGSETSRQVDVRVIGATHRDLGALVAAGRFREDLLYRLNVISIRIPPLRERFGDVALLVNHFLKLHAAGRAVTIERPALEALAAFGWPGNVRQLDNEIRRALVLADDVIRLEHLSPDIAAASRGPAKAQDEFDLRSRVDALEADLVRAALRRTEGNQTRAAELLGLSRFGLQKMMKRLEIRSGRSDA